MIIRSSAVELANALSFPASLPNREALISSVIKNGDREQVVAGIQSKINSERKTIRRIIATNAAVILGSVYFGAPQITFTVGILTVPASFATCCLISHNIGELRITLTSIRAIPETSQRSSKD